MPPAAQDPSPAFGDDPEYGKGDYIGVGSCANGACHGASQPMAESAIRGDEYTSRVLDPHFRAYEILNSELSREIASYLEPGTPATRMGLCLDCHTVNVSARRDKGLERLDGVSCEGCHGAAGGWWDRHYEEGWDHEDSVAAGLNDLRRPAARADVCMDCHQGNADQNVDHRLIAAGHPVLTFELDNYASIPELVHWRSDRERERPSEPRRCVPGPSDRSWVCGKAWICWLSVPEATVHGRNSPSCRAPAVITRLIPVAVPAATAPGVSGRATDFRTVCRHGVPPSGPSRAICWTRSPKTPARPSDPKFAELSKRVRSMSDRQGVAELAGSIADELKAPLRKADDARWTRDRARRLMQRLAEDRLGVLRADEASARQVALALQSLSGFLVETGGLRLDDPRIDAVDSLFEQLDEPGWDSEAFASRLADVGR